MTNKKDANKPSLMANIMTYAREYKWPFVAAVVLAMIGSVSSIIGPDRLGDMTDKITEGLMSPDGIDLERISQIAITLVVIYVIGAVFTYIQTFVMATIIQNFSRKLRKNVSDKIDRLTLRYFDSHSHGDTLSRVTNDLDLVGQSLSQTMPSFVPSVTLLIGTLAMMLYNNAMLTLVALASVVIGFVGIVLILGRSQGYFVSQQKNLANVNSIAEESYTGQSVLTTINARNQVTETFSEANEALYDSVWHAQFLSGIMQPLMQFIGNFGYVAVSVVGSIMTLNGDISFGVVVSFMVYVRMFTQPLGQLSQSFASFQSASAALNRVFEFLNEEEMVEDTNLLSELPDVHGDVTFEHVNFGYEADQPIIKDFSVTAKSGQKIAIVGPTGAGKTTIVNLLMKFYPIDSGEIYIDGIPTSEISRAAVHDQFSMVLQDTWLFEGTIRENLIFNQDHITDEMVESAAAAVGIDHFINTLPKGYDTVLDDSVTLSVGQKQLFTIARALLKDAPLLILDEATSSVDTRTEVLLQEAMDKLMEGRTSFVIAHRLSTIRNADIILVMDKGNIIEQGNHEALMAKDGFYADLYNSQFAK
ncbi:ABC transporter ATP-binding protein [Aerococcus viridans]|uniref:ABC transporter ATP-binding protein n=1 Tax=Aerococcus viridans TaxID=1377 RepID=UPI00223BF9B8|nr:ABC transporter ATP-binding protein [Aerococcus viridans]MCT1798716.1 ABC transporter ATP-binding protein/permease [Aerococcus viridans]